MHIKVEDLLQAISKLPDDYVGIGITEVFSWRGSYDEPAFSLGEASKAKMLEVVDSCLTRDFYGYKGGKYRYSINSSANFENYISNWTDGEYLINHIANNPNGLFFSLLINKE